MGEFFEKTNSEYLIIDAGVEHELKDLLEKASKATRFSGGCLLTSRVDVPIYIALKKL